MTFAISYLVYSVNCFFLNIFTNNNKDMHDWYLIEIKFAIFFTR